MSQFKELVESNSATALLKRLGEQDARSVHEWEMERLIILLSTIFFQIKPSDKMQVHFLCKEVLSAPTTMGQTWTPVVGRPYSRIEMKPNDNVIELVACGNVNGRAMTRLSTFLHKLVHAYMQYYGCRGCESFREDLRQLDRHGRAWQLVATSVERAAMSYLGLPFTLSRFEAVQHNWSSMEFWPTQKEVRDWELD
jgi:hypothetical protein